MGPLLPNNPKGFLVYASCEAFQPEAGLQRELFDITLAMAHQSPSPGLKNVGDGMSPGGNIYHQSQVIYASFQNNAPETLKSYAPLYTMALIQQHWPS